MIDGKAVEELYDPNVKNVLEEIAQLAGQFGAARIVIEGHTDSSMRGQIPPSLVKELSLNRANAIKEALVHKYPDLDPNRFNVDGVGWDRPADPNDPLNQTKNRRVEVKVLTAEKRARAFSKSVSYNCQRRHCRHAFSREKVPQGRMRAVEKPMTVASPHPPAATVSHKGKEYDENVCQTRARAFDGTIRTQAPALFPGETDGHGGPALRPRSRVRASGVSLASVSGSAGTSSAMADDLRRAPLYWRTASCSGGSSPGVSRKTGSSRRSRGSAARMRPSPPFAPSGSTAR